MSTASSPTRSVFQADALAWLDANPAPEGASVVTSLPDVSELPDLDLEGWTAWFVGAAERVIRWVPEDGVAIFFQSDIRSGGAWIDKGYLVMRAAEAARARVLWHKIVCRKPPGSASLGRPTYSHMIAVARGAARPRDRSPAFLPDVLPDAGLMTWSRAMGAEACRVACAYLARETATRVVVDPFCGRGTTLAIANEAGFDAIGVERSAKRCRASRGFAAGSRARLSPRDLPRFPGESLFDRVARAVCRAECLPRKELYEAWEVARRARRRLRGGRVVDLACGHALVASLMLLLDDSSKAALAVDTRVPPSASRLLEELTRTWPRLRGRVAIESGSLAGVTLDPGDVVVSVHACGALTDEVIARAVEARARLAVLPCCHDAETCDTGSLDGWLDAPLAIDVTRAARLRAAGYSVRTQAIPLEITPKNRLLLGEPTKADDFGRSARGRAVSSAYG